MTDVLKSNSAPQPTNGAQPPNGSDQASARLLEARRTEAQTTNARFSAQSALPASPSSTIAPKTSPAAADGDKPANKEKKSSSLFARLKAIFTPKSAKPELAAALEGGAPDLFSSLPRARREMIERVIAFDEKRVRDVMAPRADIIAVDVDTPLDALVKAFAEAGHSRMPVFRDDLDDPIGMVHIKDVVALLAKGGEQAAGDNEDPSGASQSEATSILRRIRHDVLYAPPSMRITDLLLRMQASRIHMALVIDEFGGTDGLVTIEDLVEEIVGDINDEHDDDEAPMVVANPGDGWDVDARVELDDFMQETGLVIGRDDEDEEIDTLGGLIFYTAGRVPQRGEVLRHQAGLEFEIVDADARKIRKIRVRKRIQATTDENAQLDGGTTSGLRDAAE